MILLGALVSVCLLAVANSKVSPRHVPNITVTHEDIFQFNISNLFDMSHAIHPHCDVISSPAHYFNFTTPLALKDLSQYHFGDEPEIANLISNNSIYAIYDDSQLVIQQVNNDHLSFGNMTVTNFGTPGVNATCTDLEMNHHLQRLYVACFQRVANPEQDHIIWIVELNATDGKKIKTTTGNLSAYNLSVSHRLQIRVVPLWTEDHNLSMAVIVYDQGMTNSYMTKNQWAWVLHGAWTGDLTDYGVAMLTDLPFQVVYDMFGYHFGLMITGKETLGHVGKIRIGYCGIKGKNETLKFNCSSTVIDTPFGTHYGYVGRLNTGQYIEANTNPNNTEDHIAVCDFGGEWSQSNFINTNSCTSYLSFSTLDNVSISNIEGNSHQLVVKYTHADSTYAGFSLHNFDLHIEYNQYDVSTSPHLIPLGRSLVSVTKTNMSLYRMVTPYVLVQGSDLCDGFNMIRIQCTDQETTSPVTVFFNITKMTNMRDMVFANQSLVPEFGLYEGDEQIFQMDPHTVIGNDLRFSVSVDQRFVNLTQINVYDTERIDVNFTTNKTSGNYSDIHFSNRYAVAKDAEKDLIGFFDCFFRAINQLTCIELATVNTSGMNISLRRDLQTVQGHWMFNWGVDHTANKTYIFMYDGRGKVETFHINHTAFDATATTHRGVAYVTLSAPHIGAIFGWAFYDDPAHAHELPTLWHNMTRLEFFCPTEMDFNAIDSHVLEIMSICPGLDHRIIRYNYPPRYDNRTGEWINGITSQVPLNYAFHFPQMCSLGTEFAVFSRINGGGPDLRSYSHYNDRNRYFFGTLTDELQLGPIKQFNCVTRSGMFTTVSTDRNNNTVLAVYWGNNQYRANHKVYNTRRHGLNDYVRIGSYELYGQVIHTLIKADGTHDFLLSFTNGPVLDIKMLHGIGNHTVPFSLRFGNGHQRAEFVRNVFVTVPYLNITKKVIKTLNYPYGKYNLERYVDHEGPITGAKLKTGYGAVLYGRVQDLSAYSPAKEVAHVMDMIETYGKITVTSHASFNGSSLFYIFHNYNKFVGTAHPGFPTRHFHFAPFNNTDNNSILIAYSSFDVNGSALEFIALNGSHRIGVGRAIDDPHVRFEKIRVAPLANGNRWVVFALDRRRYELHSYFVNYTNGRITSRLINITEEVYDFTTVDLDYINTVVTYYLTYHNRTALQILAYSRTDSYETGAQPSHEGVHDIPKIIKQSNLKDNDDFPFDIRMVEAAQINKTHAYIIIDSMSQLYYEIVFDLRGKDKPNVYVYWKVPNTEAGPLKGNERHFVVVTTGTKGRRSFEYHIYERQQSGGSPHLYWNVPAEQNVKPFSLTTDYTERVSHFQVLTNSPGAPLIFSTIGPMEIEIARYADLKSIVIEVDGIPPQPSVFTNFSEIYPQAVEYHSVAKIQFNHVAWVIGALATVAAILVVRSFLKASQGSVGHASI